MFECLVFFVLLKNKISHLLRPFIQQNFEKRPKPTTYINLFISV